MSVGGDGGHGDDVGVLGVALTASERVGCTPETDRIEGLDEPAVGPGSLREEHIGRPVEKHEHRHLVETVGPFLVTERHADGHSAHVADLEVEDDQFEVIFVIMGRVQDIAALVHSNDRCLVVSERGIDNGGNRIGVGGDEEGTHGAARYRSASPSLHRSDSVPPPSPGERVLDIEVTTTEDHTVCRPNGELDAYTVGQFREVLGDLAETKALLIDLSDVPFMDSAGLGALIGGIRRTRESGGEVSVACSRPTLTRLLHTTGFDRIVPVVETVEEALEALKQAQADTDSED